MPEVYCEGGVLDGQLQEVDQSMLDQKLGPEAREAFGFADPLDSSKKFLYIKSERDFTVFSIDPNTALATPLFDIPIEEKVALLLEANAAAMAVSGVAFASTGVSIICAGRLAKAGVIAAATSRNTPASFMRRYPLASNRWRRVYSGPHPAP